MLQAKSSAFKCRLKVVRDDSDVTLDGRLFQTCDTVATEERSPMVERCVPVHTLRLR